MGISIDCYRQRIGCFRSNALSKLKGYSYLKKQKKSFNSGSLFSLLLRTILLLTIFGCAASISQVSSSSFTRFSISNGPTQCSPKHLIHCSCISWSSSNGGNKLVHAISGNKRRLIDTNPMLWQFLKLISREMMTIMMTGQQTISALINCMERCISMTTGFTCL